MPGVTVNRSYKGSVFRGASVSIDDSIRPDAVANVLGVKTVHYNSITKFMYKREYAQGAADILHVKTGLVKAVEETGLDGSGVKIGIIDSGVDYSHPDLGACWKTKGCKWQFGMDLVGDDYSTYDGILAKPDDDPMDCLGHGTHVSGIIGASGDQVRGVAPGATLGMYHIIGCSDGVDDEVDDEIFIGAMEAAAEDGVDIVNISAGQGIFASSPIAVAASNLVAKGIVVVASVGNDGNSGLLTPNTPSTAKGVIGVGVTENWKVKNPGLTFTSSAGPLAVAKALGRINGEEVEPRFIFDKDVPVVAPVDSAGNTDGCSPFDVSLEGKVALLDMMGDCPYPERAANAKAAGAIGMILTLYTPRLTNIDIGGDVEIPVAGITQYDSELIHQMLEECEVTVRALDEKLEDYLDYDLPSAGQMYDASSYGPTPELALVPVVSAPGGFIWSTYPIVNGSYATLSGTSMSAPYITGTIALLKQQRPELTVDEIYSIIVTTAKPLTNKNTGIKITPHQSGAGLVDMQAVLNARALITPSAISINETAFETPTGSGQREAIRTLTIKNTDPEKTLHVSLYHSVADSVTMWQTNGIAVDSYFDGYSVITWPPNKDQVNPSTLPQLRASELALEVAPGDAADLNVIISAPSRLKESERWFYGGFAEFKLQWDGEKATSRQVVPYGGFNGDFNKMGILRIEDDGYPMIVDYDYNPVNASDVKASAENIFSLLYNVEVPTRMFTASLIDAKGRFAGYLPKGCTPDKERSMLAQYSSDSIDISNQVQKTCDKDAELFNLTAGKYHVRLAALRPFGDLDNADDLEVWESDQFVVE